MSYNACLNITDHTRTVSGEVHGFMGICWWPALTAEPETIEELATALGRFIKPESDWPVFQGGQLGVA